jgi:hypothetical protein
MSITESRTINKSLQLRNVHGRPDDHIAQSMEIEVDWADRLFTEERDDDF